MTRLKRRLKMLFAGFAALFVGVALSACQTSPVETLVPVGSHSVFLVRHAEKLTGDNPSLTDAGHARADLLSDILADTALTDIHSTDYKRTLETAAPVAAMSGLQVQLYDARDLAAFADTLRATPGIHLVVGHSNTTPGLAAALGADPGSEIYEKSEYDRLYVVVLGDETVSRIERFGTRYVAETE